MTNADKVVVSETRYAPFGEVRWQVGSPVTDITYTGQRDDGFGLMDYNARFCSIGCRTRSVH